MNSLNILSARVIRSSTPGKSGTQKPRSYSDGNLSKAASNYSPKRSASLYFKTDVESPEEEEKESGADGDDRGGHLTVEATPDEIDEKTPLLSETESPQRPGSKYSRLRIVVKKLVDALAASLKWVLSTLASPGVYFITGFYDEKGKFSPLVPIRKLGRVFGKRNGRKSTGQAVGLSGSPDTQDDAKDRRSTRRNGTFKDPKRKPQSESFSTTATSESEADVGEKNVLLNPPSERRPHINQSSSSEEVPQARRSIRIKLYNEDTTKRRKQRRGKADATGNAMSTSNDAQLALTIANIKSPTSPTSSLRMTKYPRTQVPPRPLIPLRQPSYSSHNPRSSRLSQKTLVIDLDETLIHSLAKGGRMSSGHMVEVKLNTPIGYGGAALGPQHPILYYVHKRPHCDDFLRKVCKWYNLVVFTASVQEYADPVIDWLEQERKYFSGRFYRQHCTFRNGAYIKDLSSVEPDLSKVMILDNSPLSYIFHEGMEGSTGFRPRSRLMISRQRNTYRRMDQ